MPSSIVVGGGLAGLIAARGLAREGWQVTLLERSDHLGGKADALESPEHGFVEHGYHVFPAWYSNIRALLRELDIELVDFDRYHYFRKGEYPERVTVMGPSGAGPLLHNVFRGLMPWYQTVLFGYSVIDMLSRPLSERALLDRISQLGLMRAAWYMTDSVAELNQENVLKASAIPAYDMSAMTAKKIAAFWVKQASPFLSVLQADLQTAFIDPIAASTLAAGVEVRFGQDVVAIAADADGVTSIRCADGTEHTADAYVVTTPLEVTRDLIGDDLARLDATLGDIHHLEAEPMSALHIYLEDRLPDIPREHVFLHGGRYGLSFIDNSQTWPDSQGTYLSFIASNFSPLSAVSDAVATELLMDEISEYLPIDRSRAKTVLNTNISEPLFINTIGAWPNRPEVVCQIPNLYFAGDWVRNEIDLACMEGGRDRARLRCSHTCCASARRTNPTNVLPRLVRRIAPRVGARDSAYVLNCPSHGMAAPLIGAEVSARIVIAMRAPITYD